MHTLTLFYDAHCGLCSRVRQWLSSQPSYVRLEFIPYDAEEAEARLPGIRHLRADQEIIVMADSGEVWQGAGAWVMCLWALREFRAWSARLASPPMQAIARKIVHWISQNRISLSRLLQFKSDAELAEAADKAAQEQACALQPRKVSAARPQTCMWHDLDLID
jgi:predicted DCC family thiol-disulfide oxidoreductase YuxK